MEIVSQPPEQWAVLGSDGYLGHRVLFALTGTPPGRPLSAMDHHLSDSLSLVGDRVTTPANSTTKRTEKILSASSEQRGMLWHDVAWTALVALSRPRALTAILGSPPSNMLDHGPSNRASLCRGALPRANLMRSPQI